MAKDSYKPFLDNARKMMDQPPTVIHVDFNSAAALSDVLSAPVTELITLNFDGQPPADYGEGADKLIQALEKEAVGLVAATWGQTHEVLDSNGVKGNAVVAAVGWSSIESHMACRETEVFKEHIHLLRSTSKGAEMHHIAAMKFFGESKVLIEA